MPYIRDEGRRVALDFRETPIDAGELNYVLSTVAAQYVLTHGLKYSVINDVLGAFAGASAEFYRRIAAPYEDKKIRENGDVFPGALLPRDDF